MLLGEMLVNRGLIGPQELDEALSAQLIYGGTLGTCLILVGVLVHSGGAMGIKALLCAIFVLLSSPTGAHALARGAHRSGVKLWKGSVMDKYAEDQEGKLDQ